MKKQPSLSGWRHFVYAREGDGWHYAVFRILWAQFHFSFALFTAYWTFYQAHLPPLPYPGPLAAFSLLPAGAVFAFGVLHALLGLCALLGWHTRAVQWLLCATMLPLFFHSLATYQNHYAFYLFITFYLALAPSERFLSLDSLAKRRALSAPAFAAWRRGPTCLLPQRLMLLQLAMLYFFAGINKFEPLWFARWSTTGELPALAVYPFTGRLWELLMAHGLAGAALAGVALLMVALSFGVFVANRYPIFALLALFLHLLFDLTLPILEFTGMCGSILFLSLFPVRHPVVRTIIDFLRGGVPAGKKA